MSDDFKHHRIETSLITITDGASAMWLKLTAR